MPPQPLRRTTLPLELLQHPLRRPSCAFTSAAPALAPSVDPKKITVSSLPPSSRKWADLNSGQKVTRTASTSASALTILAGLLVTGGVFTVIYLEILAPDSMTSWFNHSHKRIKEDAACRRLLGDGKLRAFGEETYNRWARNKPIAHSEYKDRNGNDHLIMHFNVEGDLASGRVNLHLLRRAGEKEYHYDYLYLDVPGKTRVVLEGPEKRRAQGDGAKKGLFGIQWNWK